MSNFLFSSKKKRQHGYHKLCFYLLLVVILISALNQFGLIGRARALAHAYSLNTLVNKDKETIKLLMMQNKILSRRLSQVNNVVAKLPFKGHFSAVEFHSAELTNDGLAYKIITSGAEVFVNASGLVGFKSQSGSTYDTIRPITNKGMLVPVIDKSNHDYLAKGVGFNKKLIIISLTDAMHLEIGDILYANPVARGEFRDVPVARVADVQQSFDGEWMVAAEPMFWSSSLTQMFAVL